MKKRILPPLETAEPRPVVMAYTAHVTVLSNANSMSIGAKEGIGELLNNIIQSRTQIAPSRKNAGSLLCEQFAGIVRFGKPMLPTCIVTVTFNVWGADFEAGKKRVSSQYNSFLSLSREVLSAS